MQLPHIVILPAVVLALGGAIFVASSCSNPLTHSHDSQTTTSVSHTHSYKGTASVGDFITFTIDDTAQTLSYTNISNGLSGSGTFTVNSDGSYTIVESSGCFTDAVEIPGYALVLRGLKTGPTQSTISLVTCIDSQVTTIASVANQSYNYIQFRTQAGGLEVGHVSMGADAEVTHSGYWPYGSSLTPSQPYSGASTFPAPTQDPTTGALDLVVTENGITNTNYIFATTNGLLAVDTPNGSLVCLQEASSNTLQASSAGTYSGLCYQKNAASTGMGNVESPANGTIGKVTITLDTSGNLLIKSAGGTTMASGVLVPFAGSALQTGIGDPCSGFFYTNIGSQQVFVTFTGSAMLFSSFTPIAGMNPSYNYFYGVGLMTVSADG